MKLRPVLIGLACLALFYVLSFGPVVFLVARALIHRTYSPSPVTLSLIGIASRVYYPHLLLMAFTDSYYAYGNWWFELSGVGSISTRQDFKKGLGY